jgi:hypothetical protein
MSDYSTEEGNEFTLEKLNKLYQEAEQCDKHSFAEMRSAILLVAGEHYSKRADKLFERLRDSKNVSHETKIRLTKNHTQKIVKAYVNQIVSAAPGVRVLPQLETELQDKKSAEMNQAVWDQGKQQNDICESGKIMDWCDDFVQTAEVCTKIYFDPDAGDVIGYEQLTDESGEGLFETEDGQMVTEQIIGLAEQVGQPIQAKPAPDMQKPKKAGMLKFEDYQGFNVLRCPMSKKMDDSPYLILRKMSKLSELKLQWPDKKDKIQASEDKTFLVFDASSYGYRQSEKDETLVKEYYYRPCRQYPNGYYVIATEDCKLDEGELPKHGEKVLFPVIHEIFDRAPTTPRGVGIVKTVRPYQVEINRTGSKIAEHQMTVGDDKVITMNGSKMSAGATVPGIREVKVTGQPPIVLEGRSGNQFIDYMLSQIEEMYNVAGLNELLQKNSDGQYDVYAMLFQAARKKVFFQRHIARFERYLKNVCMTYLEFARYYLNDEAVVFAVGRRERVNIAEFKNDKGLCYQIKLEPQTTDIESQMGKQVVATQILQYVGSKLEAQDIGKLIKNMPLANFDDSFGDFTMDYDNANNLMLALERGEMPAINPSHNAEYMIQKLNHRMGQADFQFLHEFIQGNYSAKLQEYMQILQEQKDRILRDQQQMIPTTGASVACEIYVAYDPNDPSKSRRARVPYDALQWLINKLEDQGVLMNSTDQLPMNIQSDLSQGQEPQMPEGQQLPQQ